MKPLILITNDDGVDAHGIDLLMNTLEDCYHLAVVAPALDRSGTGVGVTFQTPLKVENLHTSPDKTLWKVWGTPADCVKLGLSILLPEPPKLIVSGINAGSNAGRTVLYSGTVGGVIEGTFRGIPGIAFSFHEQENPDSEAALHYIPKLVKHVLEHPLPRGTFLNVNFPSKEIPLKGIKLASQGKSYWIDDPNKTEVKPGEHHYLLGGIWADHKEEEESDVSLLKQGFITVVPIHVDELTDRSHLESRKSAFEKAFP